MKNIWIWGCVLFIGLTLVGCDGTQATEIEREEHEQEMPKEENQEVAKDIAINEQEIKDFVQAFGDRLKDVSLLAPEKVVQESIEESYGEFVTEPLLSSWLKDTSSAPGREVSSPWPERIEVKEIEKVSEATYSVNGKIIEVTSKEVEEGGSAAERLIKLMVKNVGDQWLIDEVELGEYID